MREDDFTSTVEGAAAYERQRAQSDSSTRWPEDDLPSASELAEDEREIRAAREARYADAVNHQPASGSDDDLPF